MFAAAGPMFPVGLKWEMTRNAPGHPAENTSSQRRRERAGDVQRPAPGARPIQPPEAMTVAGYTVGGKRLISCAASIRALTNGRPNAIEQAGYLGHNILGRRGFN